MRATKLYILPFMLILLLGLLWLLPSKLFLYRINEHLPLSEIVEKQLKGGVLYSGLSNNAEYIRRMYASIAPDIVVMGDSRSLVFRQYLFNQKFFNFAGNIRNANRALQWIHQTPEDLRPKLLILTVSFWEFIGDEKVQELPVFTDFRKAEELNQLILPVSFLFDNTISVSDFFGILRGKYPSYLGPIPRVGLGAVLNNNGTGPDGSVYHGNQIWKTQSRCTTRKITNINFENQIKSGTRVYKHYKNVDKAMVEGLVNFSSKAKKLGTNVIIFVPPVSPSLFRLLSELRAEFSYIEEWRHMLLNKLPGLVDFHDPNKAGLEDDNFYDAMHGEEIAFLKIMLKASADSTSPLYPFIDRDHVEKLLDRGKIVLPVMDKFGKLFRKFSPGPEVKCTD
jgi:hypothetical protein